MTTPNAYSFTRYLDAKRTIDDRALNRHVWNTLRHQLAVHRAKTSPPLQVLEIGAGIGTMIERVHDWWLWPPQCPVDYLAIDADRTNLDTARTRPADLPPAFHPQLEEADLFELVDQRSLQGRFDLMIAHAFLDLVDLPTTLPRLVPLLKPGALAYFTINFDGATLFEPAIDPVLDPQIEALYHATMDQRVTGGRPAGDSRTGRHLFGELHRAGFDLLAAGGSDWVVFAGREGYLADEAYFLHFIVHTVHQALADHPKLAPGALAEWATQRHRQVETGELVYIAHQLDFVCIRPESQGA